MKGDSCQAVTSLNFLSAFEFLGQGKNLAIFKSSRRGLDVYKAFFGGRSGTPIVGQVAWSAVIMQRVLEVSFETACSLLQIYRCL